MRQGWRWFGDADAISLKEIRQAGVADVVAALYERGPGEVWPVEEIMARQRKVRAAGMVWSVVESVPVHEDVKKRTGRWQMYVENYKKTLRNLAKCGIRTVCYNFMPLLDWMRTNLAYALPDGSTCLEYNEYELAAFDIFRLRHRPRAESRHRRSGNTRRRTPRRKEVNCRRPPRQLARHQRQNNRDGNLSVKHGKNITCKMLKGARR